MFRPLQIIVTAILMSRPAMPPAEARHYARVLQEEAAKHAFDPLTAVAIVHFETHWQPGLVSPDGEDYGLGQIRARFMTGCRGDEDPVNAPSDACRAAKAQLLVGENNLRRMAVIITANRDLCKAKVGTADLPQWLAGYEGLNSPSRDRWCAPSALTMRVIDYRKELVEQLVPHPPRPVTRSAAVTRPAAPTRPAPVVVARPATPPVVARPAIPVAVSRPAAPHRRIEAKRAPAPPASARRR